MTPKRPSHKELTKKLRVALDCLNEPDLPRVLIDRNTVRPQISANMESLQIKKIEHYWNLVTRCLKAALNDPETTYTGSKPPELSTSVKMLKNCEMFAFSIYDITLGITVYTKFAIKKMNDGTHWYGHITCHKDEPK